MEHFLLSLTQHSASSLKLRRTQHLGMAQQPAQQLAEQLQMLDIEPN